MVIHCDNLGVISRGNDPSQPLLDGQTQADALRTLKHLVRENPFSSVFTWVEGHAMERKGINNCTLEEKLNDTADTLAKKVLISGVASKQLIDSRFPFKHIRAYALNEKVTGSLRLTFEQH